MLARMEPAEFDERWAHWLVEPWGQEMQVASAVGAMILNSIRQATATEKISEDELHPLDVFLPRKSDDGAQLNQSTLDASLRMMRSQAGV